MELKQKNSNLGLEVLRMILSFWVVAHHCCIIKNQKLKYFMDKKRFHVPTFMFMSFYFFYKNISQKNIIKIKLRFERLLIPYIIWPLFILFINNLFYIIFGVGQFKRRLLLKDFIFQLLFGRCYHDIFWYHFNLIFITFIFTIICFIYNKHYLFIFEVIGILSYILQYSFININLFFRYKFYCFTLGRFFEMMPIAITGFIFGSFDLISRLKKNKGKILFFSIIIIYMLIKYEVFNNIKGFDYQGLIFNIAALFLFSGFSVIPLEKIQIKKLLSLIIYITKYTGGIYYLHNVVRDYLVKRLGIIKGNLFGCICMYIFCFYICLIGSNLFINTKLKYLFF